ncbi:MAG: hypothetical protein LH629_09770, partial [Ignavibacteria bacterium]|nr:hypothetical protein [Ignavibacteria bacterium]
MNYTNKKVAGVWLDHVEAIVINTADKTNKGDYKVAKTIANIQRDDKTNSEKSHNNKEVQQRRKYYEEIKNYIQGFDVILLFGTGQAQEELKNYLNTDKHFSAKEIIIKTGNRLSE